MTILRKQVFCLLLVGSMSETLQLATDNGKV